MRKVMMRQAMPAMKAMITGLGPPPCRLFVHGAETRDGLPIQRFCNIPNAAMRGQLRKSETVLSASFLLMDILHGWHWSQF
jgi:hypothetical protein